MLSHRFWLRWQWPLLRRKKIRDGAASNGTCIAPPTIGDFVGRFQMTVQLRNFRLLQNQNGRNTMSDAVASAATSNAQHVDVAVVGAGFAGLYLLHRLRKAGFTRVVTGGGRRRRRHLVLEPLSRRALRHPDHRLQLHLRSRAGGGVAMVGEIRHPARDPALSRLRRRSLRPAARHPLRHAGSRRRRWDEAAQRWQLTTSDGAPVSCRYYIMASGCLSVAQAARDRRRRGLQGRGLLHRPLAARGGRASPASALRSSAPARRASRRSR